MTPIPPLGPSVPRRGSAALRALGRAVLAAMRFRVVGEIPDVPKMVIAVAPHTSNWDFVVGAATMFALDLKLDFLAKHTLFRGPFGPVLRWMGGIPVDRASAHGVVGEAVEAFAAVPARVLAIAPEGTRKKVTRYKTGFLHIARGAGVPVLLATFDWGARCVRMGPLFDTSDDPEADIVRIEAFYARVRGRRPR
ncbi:MAG TPA: 1-acyl-sn-glycerol-3-phosphate acyltransferase [Usitatibacter sp.]|nr:1-acyl-sn-glycerol-3-phosphate acyltransferase [Usitatibacter sp.]